MRRVSLKFRWLLVALVVAVAVGVAFALDTGRQPDAARSNGYPELYLPRVGAPYPESVSYRQAPSLPAVAQTLPNRVMVYKFVSNVYDEGSVRQLADRLGFAGTLTRDTRGWYFLQEGAKRLAIDPTSGKWNWIDEVQMWGEPPSNQGSIPTDAEARIIAEAWLENLGFLADGLRFDHVADATVSSMGTGEVGVEPDPGAQVISKQVFFVRYLDGLRVVGASRIVVGVGANGEIVGVVKAMKDVGQYEEAPLRSYDAALADVLDGNCQTDIDEAAREAVLESVEVALYEDPGDSVVQPFLQPVYLFRGIATSFAGKHVPFVSVTPALPY